MGSNFHILLFTIQTLFFLLSNYVAIFLLDFFHTFKDNKLLTAPLKESVKINPKDECENQVHIGIDFCTPLLECD